VRGGIVPTTTEDATMLDIQGGSYTPAAARYFYSATRFVGARLGVQVDGIEHIPRHGPALLVANHSFGYDSAFPVAAIEERVGRRVWMLGDHLWWKVPIVRRVAASIGVVDGTPESVDRLLAERELMLVLPGGMREAVKPRELRYQLLWGHRYGFVRAAIRHRAPLIPLACVGADDLFDFVGNAYARGARWLGKRGLPLPLPSRVLPIPHFSQLRFIIGEPIVPDASPEQADDLAVLRRVRHEVAGALHELIENELARRAGIEL
jgi:1-acyl-sn-glycerol-3-phosphate acyltransferase